MGDIMRFSCMHLEIAGQDRTADIGADLTRRATRHQGPLSRWATADSALCLQASRDADEYMAHYCRLLRLRYAISTEPFPIPGKAGATGHLLRRIKGFLWKALRYQHDRMAFQQNAVNEQVISALEFQREAGKNALLTLERRIRELEAEVTRLQGHGAQ